jgi:hypothetical protein
VPTPDSTLSGIIFPIPDAQAQSKIFGKEVLLMN